MTFPMYDASIPTFTRALGHLAGILQKAADHAAAKNIDPAVLIESRLYPDMFPLLKQVQRTTDIAKSGAARLAQTQPPSFEDNETTFPQLIERVRKTIAYLETLKPEQFEGADERMVTWQIGERTKTLRGISHLQQFVLPNFFFHETAAYAILRHNGVKLGKRDFLGGF
ncbi:hypothetical protein DSM104443_03150 [Usitatibacter rugosus]|uniref:DUF1993 domain-containing protein n=1 Tax=Usitatibacter rugosus TaxID=2732067 RepID=A0A6M4H2L5_9PROT|nr:DUF1993 domain-containing protein [Usitatibacter rugosus]QJR12067.1 hypothetical protein DSM104443_03150 [Usitatibacter rugosus]